MADHNDIILKIINCVKQYPALYDTAHEDYNRYYKKIQIWNSIATEVNYSDGKSAQTKWRNIRDSYVKHLKSLQTTEPAYRKYRNWQWVDQMAFLKKFLGGNKHKNTNKSMDNVETSLIEVVESVYGDPSNFNETEPAEVITGQKRKSETDLWFNNESFQPDCENFYQKDYVVENNPIDPNLDATDLLFLSYAKTLKGFSTRRQVQTKMKICELMGHAELDEMNEKNVESNYVDSSENICDIIIPNAQGTVTATKGVSEADSSDKERKKKIKS